MGLAAGLFAAEDDHARGARLVAEGDQLQKQGKLAEARDKYAEAVGYSKKAKGELNATDRKIDAEVSADLQLAKQQFAQQQYAAALAALKQADHLRPGKANVSCDLGITYRAMGDRSAAVAALDACERETNKTDDHVIIEQMRTELLTGESAAKLPDPQRTVTLDLDKQLLEDERVLVPRDLAGSNPSKGSTTGTPFCTKILGAKDSLPKSPSVLYDLGVCSEHSGQLDGAVQFYESYLQAAPQAENSVAIHASLTELKTLLAYNGPAAAEIKAQFGDAARLTAAGKYDRVRGDYEEAVKAAPSFAPARWRLGTFCASMGDVECARRELTEYAALSQDAVQKQRAVDLLDDMDGRKERYLELTDAARAELAEVRLNPGKLNGFERNQRYEDVVRQLREANEMFPLAPEANQLLGFIYLDADYAPGARTAYDAAAASHIDPFFFAWTNLPKKKDRYYAKIVIHPDNIQVVPLSQYHDEKTTEVADCYPVPHKMEAIFRDTPCGTRIPVRSIKLVEAKQEFINVKTQKVAFHIAPTNAFIDPPYQFAPAARRFHNHYLRLFLRYTDLDGGKLGNEGFTGGEKFWLVMDVASLATGNPFALINLGSTIETAVDTYRMVHAAQKARAAALRTQNELHEMFQAKSFEAIPTGTAQLAFRAD
ncbi:MAG: tetratricopeptide repeat protein [Bryobacteraceae bacterium]